VSFERVDVLPRDECVLRSLLDAVTQAFRVGLVFHHVGRAAHRVAYDAGHSFLSLRNILGKSLRRHINVYVNSSLLSLQVWIFFLLSVTYKVALRGQRLLRRGFPPAFRVFYRLVILLPSDILTENLSQPRQVAFFRWSGVSHSGNDEFCQKSLLSLEGVCFNKK
jgi:hypothetical protein